MNETQEYLAIMAGKKRLELEYKEGDIISGYTAHGMSARIIESLHCGQYIDGWGFFVDREFEDGDIMKMKRHFYEWKELEEERNHYSGEEENETEADGEEKEKETFLAGMLWNKKENFQLDGGRSYFHEITVENRKFVFTEKKIPGMGRVVLPEYPVCGNPFLDPIPAKIEDKWYWTFIRGGKEEKVALDPLEERAYLAVYRYGTLS